MGSNKPLTPVLLIDDDPNFIESLKLILDDEKYDIDTALTGKNAVQKLEENFYAVVIVDKRLPDIDGVNLITTLNDTDPVRRKVVITGYPSEENLKEAFRNGVHEYLEKTPENMKNLKTIVDKLVVDLDHEIKQKYLTLDLPIE